MTSARSKPFVVTRFAGHGTINDGAFAISLGEQEPVEDRAQELLLTADPGEVRDHVARLVARTDVGQSLVPIEGLTSGLDVESRERVRHVRRDAHRDTAEGLDDALEPGEIHVEHSG